MSFPTTRLITRIIHWEYWPFELFYFPVYFYFIWLAIRERSFFFFTASNPTIDFGGMIGEKKSTIFDLIPKEYYPKTILMDNFSEQELVQAGSTLSYPFIAKPDIGQRGDGVEVIQNDKELRRYGARMKVPFLLQEFVDYPMELGVFYVRNPSENFGKITSIVQKKFLSVIGNGYSTIEDLLKSQSRAVLQVDFFQKHINHVLNQIPPRDEEVIVEPIGNHCRGTTFLDVTSKVDKALTQAFDKLAKQIDGFYFGRFDLKCTSMEDLKDLKNFSIVELNGAGAEPAHIYQPGHSLFKAYKVVLNHFKMMADVSRENKKRGVKYCSLPSGLKKLLDILSYNRQLKRT